MSIGKRRWTAVLIGIAIFLATLVMIFWENGFVFVMFGAIAFASLLTREITGLSLKSALMATDDEAEEDLARWSTFKRVEKKADRIA